MSQGNDAKNLIVLRDLGITEDAADKPMDEQEYAEVDTLLRASKSPSTWRVYRSSWRMFEAWCYRKRIKQPLGTSPENIARYVASMVADGLKYATIKHRLKAVTQVHKHFGHEPPTKHPLVERALAGARRTLGTREEKKRPMRVEIIFEIVSKLPPTREGALKRAIFTVGFLGAFRRSELVGLDVEDVEFVPEGVKITIRKSKTDQERQGRTLALPKSPPLCPVAALEQWIRISGVTSGPLFRTVNKFDGVTDYRLPAKYVATFVQLAARERGLDPKAFGGHSLRAGLITTVAGKAAIHKIKEISGHKSDQELNGYIRDELLFEDNAAAVAVARLRRTPE